LCSASITFAHFWGAFSFVHATRNKASQLIFGGAFSFVHATRNKASQLIFGVLFLLSMQQETRHHKHDVGPANK
jgi:hypothetical protein